MKSFSERYGYIKPSDAISSIESAVVNSPDNISEHLNKALSLFADRAAADFASNLPLFREFIR